MNNIMPPINPMPYMQSMIPQSPMMYTNPMPIPSSPMMNPMMNPMMYPQFGNQFGYGGKPKHLKKYLKINDPATYYALKRMKKFKGFN